MLKLSLSFFLPWICALLLLGAVLFQFTGNNLTPVTKVDKWLASVRESIRQQVNKQPAESLISFVALQQQRWQLPIQLISRKSLALPAELEIQLNATGDLALPGDAGTLYLKTLPSHQEWLLQLQTPDAFEQQPSGLFPTVVLYTCIGVIMLLWLMPIVQRLWLLSKTARKFENGDLTTRLSVSRWSYVSNLEQSFNKMAHQIEQLLADNRLLSSSLSHYLRTHITWFRFGLDLVQQESDLQRKNIYLQSMERDLDRIEAMVNASLEYASLDQEYQHLKLTEVDFTQICQHAIQSCEPLLSARQLQVHLSIPLDTLSMVKGHPHWLYRACLNLLQNACRYAETHIQIELWRHDQYLCFRIKDDGTGIAMTDAHHIFLPFVRLEAQSSITPKFGLGLAIVRKILDWHNAHIELETNAPSGASFIIKLPVLS